MGALFLNSQLGKAFGLPIKKKNLLERQTNLEIILIIIKKNKLYR